MDNKEKRKESHRKWREKNREKLRQYSKAYRDKNLEKARKYDRDYYENRMPLWRKEKKWKSLREFSKNNPEYFKDYYLQHKDETTARVKKRRMLIENRLHPDADLDKIRDIYKERTRLFIETGVEFDVDHIIPLAVGGWHHHDNLQLLPSSLNTSKGSDPFWEQPGFKCWRNVPENLWPQKLIPSYKSL